jgi:hypothetical protein
MHEECLASRPQLHYQLSLLLVHVYRDLLWKRLIIDSHTYLSLGLRTLSFPNLTWKGVLTRDPSGYLTTMMSMHPLSVAYCVRKG